MRRTINRLRKYDEDGGSRTEIVFDTPKTANSRRTIPLPRGAVEDLLRWKSVQRSDMAAAGASYDDQNFLVTNEMGKYIEQRTFKDFYDRMLKDAGIGHFTFHALRHTFATRALEKGMDYKTLSALLGHYSVAFTMDTYVHCMDERKHSEMDKMSDLYDMAFEMPVEDASYPILCTPGEDGCPLYAPDFPNLQITAPTMDAGLLERKEKLHKALRQYKYPPAPTRQEQIVVPATGFLLLIRVA